MCFHCCSTTLTFSNMSENSLQKRPEFELLSGPLLSLSASTNVNWFWFVGNVLLIFSAYFLLRLCILNNESGQTNEPFSHRLLSYLKKQSTIKRSTLFSFTYFTLPPEVLTPIICSTTAPFISNFCLPKSRLTNLQVHLSAQSLPLCFYENL